MMIINGKQIARVFPRKTKATPDDEYAFVGPLTRAIRADGGGIDEVHISVTWTYDIPKAEQLVKSWEKLGVPVKIGGPAFGDRMGNFIPGLYIKRGTHLLAGDAQITVGFAVYSRRRMERSVSCLSPTGTTYWTIMCWQRQKNTSGQ